MRFQWMMVLLVVCACWFSGCAPEVIPKEKAGASDGAQEEAPAADVYTGPLKVFSENNLWGYQNEAGETMIPAQFVMAGDFTEHGFAYVVDHKGWAFIDRAGKVVVRPFIFDNGPDSFQEGLARFVAEDKFGFYTPEGKIVIPATYDFAEPFSEGKARVCTGCEKVMDGEHYTFEGGTWTTIDKP